MKENKASHTFRILAVAETVAEHGPISLNELSTIMPISRGAIWRCLDTLRDKGWVRMRNGDGAFELTSQISKVFSEAHIAAPHMPIVGQLVEKLSNLGPFHVDYGEFISDGEFVICETTRRDGYNKKALSLADDEMAIAAQLSLGRTQLLIHLRAFLEKASTDEVQFIQNGNHNSVLNMLRLRGIVWGPDKMSFSLPYSLAAKADGAIRLEIKQGTAEAKQHLISVAQMIQTTDTSELLGSDKTA